MRVLVTRPRESAIRTAQELEKRGHEPLIAPLSEIRIIDSEEADLSGVSTILATSGNGIRAFAHRCLLRNIPVFAVGSSTAAAARSAGFLHVTSAGADALALADLICRSVNPEAGALLHIAGRSSTRDFHAAIARAGFDLRVWELYETVYRDRLPEQIVRAFRAGTVGAVLVLSPESGRSLAESLRRGDLVTNCSCVVACCISSAAAATVQEIGFGALRIAEDPDLGSVLALLDLGPVGAHA